MSLYTPAGVANRIYGAGRGGSWVATSLRWVRMGAIPAFVALVLGLPSLFEPHWYGDEGIFAAVASDMRSGDTLYRDIWDHKPPMIFWTYAAIQEVGGAGMLPLRAVGLATTMATVLAVVALTNLLGMPDRAQRAGVVAALLLATPILEGNLVLTETFLVLATTLGACVIAVAVRKDSLRPRVGLYVLAGILLGIAANYKQVAFWDVGAFVLAAALIEGSWRRTVPPILCGVAIPHLVVLGVVAAQGTTSEYFYATWGSLIDYRAAAPNHGPVLSILRFLPLLIVITWLARSRPGRETAIAAFPAIWAAAAVAGTLSSTHPYPHYLQQAAPAVAILVAALHVGRPAFRISRAAAIATAVAAAAMVIVTQFEPAYRDRDHLDPRDYYGWALELASGRTDRATFDERFDERTAVSATLFSDIPPDSETLFVWGEMPWAYAITGLKNPTRYTVPFHSTLVADGEGDIIDELSAAPPDLLLVRDEQLPQKPMRILTAESYDVIARSDGWTLFARKELSTGVPGPVAAPG